MNAAAERIKDLLWPRVCAVGGCGRKPEDPGSHVCRRCMAGMPWYDEFAHGAFAYLSPLPELISAFKFGGAVHLAADLARAMETSFRRKHDASAVDLVVPVPLHPNRLRERGYNQSGLLAAELAGRLGRAHDCDSLARIRDTEHQSRSSGAERRRNLKGAFRVVRPPAIRGRTVLLVDDVMTTGETMRECAQALSAGGAYKVVPFVVAKALMDEDVDPPPVRRGAPGTAHL